MTFIVALAALQVTQPALSLTVLSSSTIQINLVTPSTEPQTGIAGYLVQFSTFSNVGPWTNIGTILPSQFPYTWTGLTQGTSYYVQAFGIDNGPQRDMSIPSVPVLAITNSAFPVPNKTVNPNVSLGPNPQGTVFNFLTLASAVASQQPGDVIQIQAGTPGSTIGNPFTYTTQLVFKSKTLTGGTAASGTATNPITWLVRSGDYVRLHTSGLGFIAAGYNSANPGIWAAPSAVGLYGQGLLHFEGVQYINCLFVDSTGISQGLELGNPTEWSPSGNPNANPYTYQNNQSLTIVSSSNCQLTGTLVHGGSNFFAGYGGWDCGFWTFQYNWWTKHGTNNGYQTATPGVVQGTGNMFEWNGHDSFFISCISSLCGHGTGPQIYGYNNHVLFSDYIGTGWAPYNTGALVSYSGSIYSASVGNAIPVRLTPLSASIQCGPNLFEYTRFIGCGPGDTTAGLPYMGFPSFGTIVRNCVFTGGVQNGHNVMEANISWNEAGASISACGRTQFYNNSVYGTPGLYDATDNGMTAAANPNTYGGDRFINNAFDGNTNSGSPVPYFIRHFQATAFCGNYTANYSGVNKGSQVINNLLNGAAASNKKDASGNVYSTTLAFGAYSTAFVEKLCAWTDNYVAFPGDVGGNLIYQPIWNNSAISLTGTVQQALAGLTLAPSNTQGLGYATPLTTVSVGGNGLTILSVGNAYPFWDGRSVPGDTGDTIAIVPAGSSIPPSSVQICRISTVNYTGQSITLTTPVNVGPGDMIYPVLSDGVTPCYNCGVNYVGETT